MPQGWGRGRSTSSATSAATPTTSPRPGTGSVWSASGIWAPMTPRGPDSCWLAHDAGGGPYYGAPLHDEHGPVPAPGYVTDVFTDAAVDFIEEESQRTEPFYLSLHYTAPHSPWAGQHPDDLTGLYADCPFDSVPQEETHPWVPLV